MMGGAQGAEAAGDPSVGAPVSAPMMTPQANEGQKMEAMTDLSMAMDILEKVLPAFGSETEEGKAVLGALSVLSKKFAQKRPEGREFQQAEIQQLVGSLPAGGGASPEMLAMMGGGGAAPQQPGMR